jgi:hypothetical protein
MNAIEIFKPGRHTSMKGESLEFSAADCAASAKAYDPAKHEAPIVIGHPSADAPAYGWVKSLAFAEGSMRAEPDQIDAAFAEAVGAGRYKKVSASFYTPKSAANPVPGVYYLRHVGFLGAQPPSVKGLRQVEFAGGDEDAVTVEFGDFNDMTVASLFRSLRDWVIGKFGTEEADKALPPWNVNSAQETAAQIDAPLATDSSYSEGTEETVATATSGASPEVAPNLQSPVQPSAEVSPPTPEPAPASSEPTEPPDPKAEELKRKEAALAERERVLNERENKAKLDGHAAFLEGLVREGRPLPCDQSVIVNFMRLLDGEQADTVSFGEGETRTPLELFKSELLAKFPKTVDFTERSNGGGSDDEDDPEVIATKAVAFQEEQRKAGIVVTTSDAVTHVRGVK